MKNDEIFGLRCGLEKKQGEYSWNSLSYYIKRKKTSKILDISLVLDQFGKTLRTARKNYLKHILENVNMKNPISKLVFGIPVGSESFLEDVEEKLKSLKYDQEIPVLKSVGAIPPEMIIQLVAEYNEVATEYLLSHCRNNEYKKIALWIIIQLCSSTLMETAGLFDLSYSGVAHSIRRFEKECSENLKIRKIKEKTFTFFMLL